MQALREKRDFQALKLKKRDLQALGFMKAEITYLLGLLEPKTKRIRKRPTRSVEVACATLSSSFSWPWGFLSERRIGLWSVSQRAKMATLSMVSVPIAPSSLSLSTRGRSSSVSFPSKVSAVFFHHPHFCPPLASIRLCILCTLVCDCVYVFARCIL